VFLFAALALALAVGVCGQAQAADVKLTHGALPTVVIMDNRVPATQPNATAVIAAGPTWWGNPDAPCFAGNTDCASDPAGGVDVGFPFAYWEISGTGTGTTCNNVTIQECGTIVVFTNTGTGSGAVSAKFSIKQGKTTLYSKSFTNAKLGSPTAAPDQIIALDNGAFKLSTKAKTGTATITVSVKVGTTTATSKANIYLM